MKIKTARLGKFVTPLVLATAIGLSLAATPVEAEPVAPKKRIYLVTVLGLDPDNPIVAECFKFTKGRFWPLSESTAKGDFEVTDKDGKKTAFEALITFLTEISGITVPVDLKIHGRAEAGGPGSTIGATGLAEVAAVDFKQNVSFSGVEMKQSQCKKLAKRINKDLGID